MGWPVQLGLVPPHSAGTSDSHAPSSLHSTSSPAPLPQPLTTVTEPLQPQFPHCESRKHGHCRCPICCSSSHQGHKGFCEPLPQTWVASCLQDQGFLYLKCVSTELMPQERSSDREGWHLLGRLTNFLASQNENSEVCFPSFSEECGGWAPDAPGSDRSLAHPLLVFLPSLALPFSPMLPGSPSK